MRKAILEVVKENEVVQCEFEKDAVTLCRLMHGDGLRWRSGGQFANDSKWKYYESKTVYSPHRGAFYSADYTEFDVISFNELQLRLY